MSKTTIPTGGLADSAITTAKINADAITGAKIADDAINSEHYTDGSIDTAHIGDSQVTSAKTSGVGGLHTLVSSQNLSSEGQTFTMDNVFSSTYDKYLIIGEKFRTGNDSALLARLRTGTSGSNADAGNNMTGGFHGIIHNDTIYKITGGASGDFNMWTSMDNDTFLSFAFTVFYPAVSSVNTTIHGHVTARDGGSTQSGFVNFGYVSISTETHTGFAIISGSANFNTTAARLSVYGITDPV